MRVRERVKFSLSLCQEYLVGAQCTHTVIFFNAST